jgi:hypothetical protein
MVHLLHVVADSWTHLRACDLDRLLDLADDQDCLPQMKMAIAANRPDLASD